jgi:hypothetical protein
VSATSTVPFIKADTRSGSHILCTSTESSGSDALGQPSPLPSEMAPPRRGGAPRSGALATSQESTQPRSSPCFPLAHSDAGHPGSQSRPQPHLKHHVLEQFAAPEPRVVTCTVRYRLTFNMLRDEYDGDAVDTEKIEGLRSTDLPALQSALREAGGSGELTVQPGGVGKGAGGPGVELVLEVAERMFNDGASVLALGAALWALVRRVTSNSSRQLSIQDPDTLGVLAVSATPEARQRLIGSHMMTPTCLTGGGPGMGTDARDVWVTPVILPTGDVWAVFSSHSGMVLGEVTVPAEWTAARGQLEPDQARDVFAALNAGPAAE